MFKASFLGAQGLLRKHASRVVYKPFCESEIENWIVQGRRLEEECELIPVGSFEEMFGMAPSELCAADTDVKIIKVRDHLGKEIEGVEMACDRRHQKRKLVHFREEITVQKDFGNGNAGASLI